MKWPKEVTPFDVVIIPSLQKNDKTNFLKAEKIYNFLIKNTMDINEKNQISMVNADNR